MTFLIKLLLCVLAVIVIVSITNGINRSIGSVHPARDCSKSSFLCPAEFFP